MAGPGKVPRVLWPLLSLWGPKGEPGSATWRLIVDIGWKMGQETYGTILPLMRFVVGTVSRAVQRFLNMTTVYYYFVCRPSFAGHPALVR